MSIRSLAANAVVVNGGVKASLTSDAWALAYCNFSGFEKVLAIVTTNTPSTSVAVLTVQFEKATLTDRRQVYSDCTFAAIDTDCSLVAKTYATSNATYIGVMEITIPSSDAYGMIRASVLTPGEGLTVDGIAVTYIMFGGSLQKPSTDYTPVYWPSS